MEIPEKEDEEGGEAGGGGGGKEELPADTHHFCHNRDIKSVATKPVGGKEGDDASSLKVSIMICNRQSPTKCATTERVLPTRSNFTRRNFSRLTFFCFYEKSKRKRIVIEYPLNPNQSDIV